MAFVSSFCSTSFFGCSHPSLVCPAHFVQFGRPPSHLTRSRLQMTRSPTMCATPNDIPDVLKSILERKRTEVDALKAEIAEQGLEHPVAKVLAAKGTFERSKDFYDALNLMEGNITVIAEIKRRSPSKGHIGYIRDPGNLSRIYHKGSAGAISVLTDLEGFGGTMDDLRVVVKAQSTYKGEYPGPCPILRKEFIIDEVQIAEAQEGGASAILLIVAALGKERTKELLDATHAFGLDALVEVHSQTELDIALEIGAEIVGVNNRDLRTFKVSLDNSFNLVKKIPDGVVKVAESGIEDCVDAWKLRDAGFNAILVGETLVTAAETSSDGNNGYTSSFNQAIGYLKAYTSKGSTEFGSNALMSSYGRGEAAKETLGELSI